MITFSSPAPLINLLTFSSIFPLDIKNAASTPIDAAIGAGNW